MRDVRPDDLVILPWNLKDEIMGQMAFIRDWGGRFVTASPETKVDRADAVSPRPPSPASWSSTSSPASDERGAFARLQCPDEFAAAGHPFTPAQTSLSRNPRAGTLRGMHYQPAPHAETKLVRAVRGRMFDVALDLRPDSPTYRQWVADELSAENAPRRC